MTQPNPKAYARSIIAALVESCDPNFAEGQQNFFQESVRTIGVRADDVKRVAKDVAREWKLWTMPQRIECCEAIWRDGRLEGPGVSFHALRRYAKEFTRDEFDVFESWLMKYVANWAHCDGTASWLVAGCLETKPKRKATAASLDEAIDSALAPKSKARDAMFARIQSWTTHESRWVRRGAAVSLVPAARHDHDLPWILEIADRLKHDEDDMVRKGLGWLFKDAWPAQPRAISAFLKANRTTLAKLVLRIAKEKMAADARAELS
jgi:3-methyladenine DNA glycosylase AlkD